MKCSLCGSPLTLLGKLGRLLHYRCSGCGMMFSKKSRAKSRTWQGSR